MLRVNEAKAKEEERNDEDLLGRIALGGLRLNKKTGKVPLIRTGAQLGRN